MVFPRLPLSVFVKLINITLEIPGLLEYLNHPVRRNYLIRSLPHSIRNKLLNQRKYIFAVHEVRVLNYILIYLEVLPFHFHIINNAYCLPQTKYLEFLN